MTMLETWFSYPERGRAVNGGSMPKGSEKHGLNLVLSTAMALQQRASRHEKRIVETQGMDRVHLIHFGQISTQWCPSRGIAGRLG